MNVGIFSVSVELRSEVHSKGTTAFHSFTSSPPPFSHRLNTPSNKSTISILSNYASWQKMRINLLPLLSKYISKKTGFIFLKSRKDLDRMLRRYILRERLGAANEIKVDECKLSG